MSDENQTTGAGSGHIEMPDDPVRQTDAAAGQQGGSFWGDDE